MSMSSRTYHGCWTCRSRKVKCGMEKPKCLRCIKANLDCGGYGIKLSWLAPLVIDKKRQLQKLQDDEEENESKKSRRQILVVLFPVNSDYKTFDEVDAVLENVDNWCERILLPTNTNNTKPVISIGPFGVHKYAIKSSSSSRMVNGSKKVVKTTSLLSLNGKLGSGLKSAGQDNVQHREYSQPPTPKSGPQPSTALSQTLYLDLVSRDSGTPNPVDLSSVFSNTKNSWVHPKLVKYAKLTSLAIKGVNYSFSEQNLLHILYPMFFPNIDSDDWEPNEEVLNKLFLFADGGVTVFPLFNKLLMLFKKKHPLFVRFFHISNYWDRIVIPMVFKIFGEFIYFHANSSFAVVQDGWLMEEKILNIKLCVVYTVLCISSFQFVKLRDATQGLMLDVDEYLRMSIELRKISIIILSSHLGTYGDDDDEEEELPQNNELSLEYYELLLFNILLMATLDTYFSVFENYDELYGVGEDIVKLRLTISDESLLFSQYLICMFDYIHTFYMSTKAIKSFNYTVADNVNYNDVKEDYSLISKDELYDNNSEALGVDEYGTDANAEDLDDDSRGSSSKQFKEVEESKEHISIKPTISHLLSNEPQIESSQISFNINFAGSKETVPSREQNVDSRVHRAGRELSFVPHIPRPEEIKMGHFSQENVYILWGVPPSLMDIFKKCVQFANEKNVFRRKKQFPRNFPKLCAELEDELLSWKYSNFWILIDGQGRFILDFHEALFYNIQSFHNSLIVYFKQLLTNQKRVDYQKNVELALDGLLKCAELNEKRGSMMFNPSFWQVLVCASNSENIIVREKYQAYWSKLEERNSIPNYWRAKQVILETWKRIDDGEETTWMEMIREWDMVTSLA